MLDLVDQGVRTIAVVCNHGKHLSVATAVFAAQAISAKKIGNVEIENRALAARGWKDNAQFARDKILHISGRTDVTKDIVPHWQPGREAPVAQAAPEAPHASSAAPCRHRPAGQAAEEPSPAGPATPHTTSASEDVSHVAVSHWDELGRQGLEPDPQMLIGDAPLVAWLGGPSKRGVPVQDEGVTEAERDAQDWGAQGATILHVLPEEEAAAERPQKGVTAEPTEERREFVDEVRTALHDQFPQDEFTPDWDPDDATSPGRGPGGRGHGGAQRRRTRPRRWRRALLPTTRTT